MRFALIALMTSTGCASLFGLGDPQPAPDAGSCVIAGYDLCGHEAAIGPIHFGRDTMIDTSVDCNVVLFDPDAGSLCVIYGTDILVDATVTARGTRPFVLAASGGITVTGTVDVSSSGGQIGAGANDRACAAPARMQSSGGGAGGSFHGKGGDGGDGAVAPAGAVKAAEAVATPTALRGGCAGADQYGDAGRGGGALALVAGGTIRLDATGRLLAGGAGAGARFGGGSSAGGGAGGGSGGMIALAAPILTVGGVIAANGGGGAGGGYGVPGADGSADATAAKGGHATMAGNGDGGAGSAGTILAGARGLNGTMATGGGGAGGGGGAAGYIILTGTTVDLTGSTISPPPTGP
jgi:hypothetical protein